MQSNALEFGGVNAMNKTAGLTPILTQLGSISGEEEEEKI